MLSYGSIVGKKTNYINTCCIAFFLFAAFFCEIYIKEMKVSKTEGKGEIPKVVKAFLKQIKKNMENMTDKKVLYGFFKNLGKFASI